MASMFVFDTHLAVTLKIDAAVGCVLAHICTYIGSICLVKVRAV